MGVPVRLARCFARIDAQEGVLRGRRNEKSLQWVMVVSVIGAQHEVDTEGRQRRNRCPRNAGDFAAKFPAS